MESAGGLVPQLIAAGVGGGIVALIGLIGVLIRIFVRLGRLEKAVEGLEVGLRATQDDLKELRRESKEDLQRTEDRLRQEFRGELRNTEERLRGELRNTEERLRDLIRAESEATRNEIRRLTDALVSHSHELDGSIKFSIPPQYPGQGSDGAGE